jgi:hypothetical protein
MAEQATRQYIFTEEQTRFMFIGTGVLMISSIVAILLLAYSRPQGRFSIVDRSQYLETVQTASQQIGSYRQNPDGTVSIPIENAVELLLERGVANAFGTATPPTATPEEAAPEETPSDAQ